MPVSAAPSSFARKLGEMTIDTEDSEHERDALLQAQRRWVLRMGIGVLHGLER